MVAVTVSVRRKSGEVKSERRHMFVQCYYSTILVLLADTFTGNVYRVLGSEELDCVSQQQVTRLVSSD